MVLHGVLRDRLDCARLSRFFHDALVDSLMPILLLFSYVLHKAHRAVGAG
jgi:hypothetical protein